METKNFSEIHPELLTGRNFDGLDGIGNRTGDGSFGRNFERY